MPQSNGGKAFSKIWLVGLKVDSVRLVVQRPSLRLIAKEISSELKDSFHVGPHCRR